MTRAPRDCFFLGNASHTSRASRSVNVVVRRCPCMLLPSTVRWRSVCVVVFHNEEDQNAETQDISSRMVISLGLLR